MTSAEFVRVRARLSGARVALARDAALGLPGRTLDVGAELDGGWPYAGNPVGGVGGPL